VLAGTGFSVSGTSLPLSLSAGQSATLNIQFDPTTAGASAGTLTIVSTSLTNPTQIVNLSGTGVAAGYEVNLSWSAPASSADPVAGYNVYRSPSGSSSYAQLNSAVLNQTSYVDTTVQNGQTYNYIVESVDSSGVTSSPSNTASAVTP
jgi:fibronectin type 3 domain-containing protein